MRRVHLLVGLLSIVAFSITGFLMSVHVPALAESDPELRLLYRSRHVYLMFAGAANVLLGLYLDDSPSKGRLLRRAASVLLLVAPGLALFAFAHDPRTGTLANARPGSLAVFAVFGGTALFLLAETIARAPSRGTRARH
jgi:hypothetical protein